MHVLRVTHLDAVVVLDQLPHVGQDSGRWGLLQGRFEGGHSKSPPRVEALVWSTHTVDDDLQRRSSG